MEAKPTVRVATNVDKQTCFESQYINGFAVVNLAFGNDTLLLWSNIFKFTMGRELIEAHVIFISEFLPNEIFC